MTVHSIETAQHTTRRRWTYDDNVQPLTVVETVNTATGEVIDITRAIGHISAGRHIELGAA